MPSNFRRERLRGVALCFIGSALAIGMAVAAWQNAATFLHPGEWVDGERYTGTLQLGRWALALMASVAITGLVFVAMGANLARTGRGDSRLTWAGGLALALTAMMAWQVRALL